MIAKMIVPGVYAIPFGFVNAFLIDADGLVLIDTGIAGSEAKILQAVQELGKKPGDIRHILLTHFHGDHTGSLAAMKQATGAPAAAHPLDAAMIREGKTMRSVEPGPGLFNSVMFRFFSLARRSTPSTPGVPVENEINDGEEFPAASGIKAIHTPGHTAGHLVFLWQQQGGVLFVGDAASNMSRLGMSFLYEDVAEGRKSIAKIAGLDFNTACFSHGKAIISSAAAGFKGIL